MSTGVDKMQVVATILHAVVEESSKFQFTVRTDEDMVRRAFKLYDMIEMQFYRRGSQDYTGD